MPKSTLPPAGPGALLSRLLREGKAPPAPRPAAPRGKAPGPQKAPPVRPPRLPGSGGSR